MGTPVELGDVRQGRPHSRLRLLAPLRYLWISHPEKTRYDLGLPASLALAVWAGYMVVEPKPQIFGEAGLLRFARDLLIMAVPFMVGALASVSMGAPGPHLDRRPVGAELYLDGEVLSLRQFLCFLLGYLSFLGLITLVSVVAASLLRDTVLTWTAGNPEVRSLIKSLGTLMLSVQLSLLTVTVLWSLYFLTDIVNRKAS